MSQTWAGIIFLATLIAALGVGAQAAGRLHGAGAHRHQAPRGRARDLPRRPASTPTADQTWSRYLRSVLAFSVVGVLFLYLFLRVQHHFWPPYAVPQMSS